MPSSLYTPQDDEIIVAGIMGERPEIGISVYRTWGEVIEIVDGIRVARGLPRRGKATYNRYHNNLIFLLDRGNFDVNRCMIKSLPWKLQEIEILQDLIPSCVPGGRSNDQTYVDLAYPNPAVRINWTGISQAMTSRLRESDRYSSINIEKAYRLRILPDYNARLAQMNRPEGMPLVVAPLQPVEPPLGLQPAPRREFTLAPLQPVEPPLGLQPAPRREFTLAPLQPVEPTLGRQTSPRRDFSLAPLQPVEPPLGMKPAPRRKFTLAPLQLIEQSPGQQIAPPRGLSPDQQVLRGYVEGLGLPMFPDFGFVWGQGWQVIDPTNPRDIRNMEANDKILNGNEPSSSDDNDDDDDDANLGLHPAEMVMDF